MSLEEGKNPNGGNRQGFESANQATTKGKPMSSVASNVLTGKITIANTEMAIIEYKGQRVLTLAMIDQVHGRPEGTAKRNFQTNKEHFVLGEDFFELGQDEIRTNLPQGAFSKFAPNGIVFFESGYLMLVKSFTDDLAWQVQRQLVKGYFKAQAPSPVANIYDTLKDPTQMRGYLLHYVEQVIALEAENQSMKVDVKALEQISKADGSLCITDAAKALGMGQKQLHNWLSANDWIYRRNGNKHWLGYSDKEKSGYLEHKVDEVPLVDGGTKIREQVRITPKGLAKLAKIFAKGEAA